MQKAGFARNVSPRWPSRQGSRAALGSLRQPASSRGPGFEGALEELWGRIGVALGWLWGRNRLPINTLCGAFDVAFRWLRANSVLAEIEVEPGPLRVVRALVQVDA